MKRFIGVVLAVAVVLMSFSACTKFDKEEETKKVSALSNNFMDAVLQYIYYEDNKDEVDSFMASGTDNIPKSKSQIDEQVSSQLGQWLKNALESLGEECTQEWIDDTIQSSVVEPAVTAAFNKSSYTISSVDVTKGSAVVNIDAQLFSSLDFSTEGMKIDPSLVLVSLKDVFKNGLKGLDYDSMVIMSQYSITLNFVMENNEWKISNMQII